MLLLIADSAFTLIVKTILGLMHANYIESIPASIDSIFRVGENWRVTRNQSGTSSSVLEISSLVFKRHDIIDSNSNMSI